jgi:hypothetical protein
MANTFLEQKYHLSKIPFELGRYDVERIGRDEEWTKLNRLLEETREQQAPRYIVLLGTYGSGKSFLLWHLHREFTRSRKSRKTIATLPVRLLDPEQSRDYIRNLVVRIFKRGFDLEADIVPLVRLALKNGLIPTGDLSAYLELLTALADPEKAQLAKRVLQGGRILRGQAIALNTPDLQQIKTNEEASDLLLAFQTLLRCANVELLVIGVDEIEFIDQQAPYNQGKIFDSLKELWDRQVSVMSSSPRTMPAPLAMVFAATPSFWQERSRSVREVTRNVKGLAGLRPFLERIPEANTVEIAEGLSESESQRLIASRMKEARTNRTSGDAIIPFTEDYVEYVFHLSQGRPRKIIEICDVVVTEAVRRKLAKIDRIEAKKILQDLLLTYEPEEAE